jgi:hypothetical protein
MQHLQKLSGDADFGNGGGLLEGIGGIAAGIGSANTAEAREALIGACHRGHVEIALLRDAAKWDF